MGSTGRLSLSPFRDQLGCQPFPGGRIFLSLRRIQVFAGHLRGDPCPTLITRQFHIGVERTSEVIKLYMPTGAGSMPRSQPGAETRKKPE